jgi:hypothetical protein
MFATYIHLGCFVCSNEHCGQAHTPAGGGQRRNPVLDLVANDRGDFFA